MLCLPYLGTIETLFALCVIVPIAFMVHSLLYGYGKNHDTDRTESERRNRRFFWHLVAITLLLFAGQFENGCTDPVWQIVFYTTCCSGIWEVVFLLTSDPEPVRKKHVS